LGIILYILLPYIYLIYDSYLDYIEYINRTKVNYILEHRFTINNNLVNNIEPLTRINKISKFLGSDNALFYRFLKKSILNEVKLDFHSMINTSGINSSYSSPIIERININSIFSNAIASVNTGNDTTNSLGIQGVNYSSNRSSVIVDSVLMNTRLKTTELLNYQSNILYCIINGLSPSLY
jgi:hypothetical protein